jgi:hypothetical protein
MPWALRDPCSSASSSSSNSSLSTRLVPLTEDDLTRIVLSSHLPLPLPAAIELLPTGLSDPRVYVWRMSVKELSQDIRIRGPESVLYISHRPRRRARQPNAARQYGVESVLKSRPHHVVRVSRHVGRELTEPYRSVEPRRQVWEYLDKFLEAFRFGVVMELIEIQS